ncbi:AraC family transcriptional regulator [Streptomyces sp. B-S-A8]|uniref:AraC family transcriptional regulator n=1 Tax=Streptomyces solicavernae TaxID=3043614 RepID=A0ABT6RZQ2_9ACTN|nr:AraC family transcriptional regulator [Streptomyces sp. B-S-A8]MDI3389908.1 AraC family transcriptional regulator [Streptomyces sp. B-S-A8]
MDPLSSLLNGIRAEGSIVTHAVLEAPWTIRFADRAPLTMLSVLRGRGTLLLPDGATRDVGPGDTAIVRGPDPFHLADRPDSRHHPHERYEIACFTEPTPQPCDAAESLSGIHWNENCYDCDEATSLIVGAYRASGRRHERLLRALPPVLVVSEETEVCAWLEQAAADAARRTAGSQALMDRLLDWGLVCTLRTWFERAGHEAPSWYRGLADPVLAPALRAFHLHPARTWTVGALAAESGVSRALFAKRFTETMGSPPLTYLTECRMDEAESLLSDTDLALAEIARTIGYADAFGFSTAFKRHRGLSPTAYRTKPAA